jgi:hypothetical protein
MVVVLYRPQHREDSQLWSWLCTSMRVAGGRDAVIEKTNEQCKKHTS